jgi:hypothetical protein
MDNGLIFPCLCERDNGEASDTNHLLLVRGFRVADGGWLGPELVVVKRWGDAGG